jgi:hypothetical protein
MKFNRNLNYVMLVLTLLLSSVAGAQTANFPVVQEGVTFVNDQLYLIGRPTKNKKAVTIYKIDKNLKIEKEKTFTTEKKIRPGIVSEFGFGVLRIDDELADNHFLDKDLNTIAKINYKSNSYTSLIWHRLSSTGNGVSVTAQKKGLKLVGGSISPALEVTKLWEKEILTEEEFVSSKMIKRFQAKAAAQQGSLESVSQYAKVVKGANDNEVIVMALTDEFESNNGIYVLRVSTSDGKILSQNKITIKDKSIFNFEFHELDGKVIITGVYGTTGKILKNPISETYLVREVDLSTGKVVKMANIPLKAIDSALDPNSTKNSNLMTVELKKVSGGYKAVLVPGFVGTNSAGYSLYVASSIVLVSFDNSFKSTVVSRTSIGGEQAYYFSNVNLEYLPYTDAELKNGRVILNTNYHRWNRAEYEIRIVNEKISVGRIDNHLNVSGSSKKPFSFIPRDHKSLIHYIEGKKGLTLKVYTDKKMR